jgi:hypothetical protein
LLSSCAFVSAVKPEVWFSQKCAGFYRAELMIIAINSLDLLINLQRIPPPQARQLVAIETDIITISIIFILFHKLFYIWTSKQTKLFLDLVDGLSKDFISESENVSQGFFRTTVKNVLFFNESWTLRFALKNCLFMCWKIQNM